MAIVLHPWQEQAVIWATAVHKGILADDVGLGKTLSAIAWAEQYSPNPVLLVAPKSLLAQWKEEVERYGARSSWHFYNYESLNKLPAFFQTVVFDEAVFLKNPLAQRTIRAVSLALSSARCLFLTATPVRNTEADLFPMMYVCLPKTFRTSHTDSLGVDLRRSYRDFVQEYCAVRRFSIGNNIVERVGALNRLGRQEILPLLRSIMLRRTKELLSLPPFSREVVYVDMTSQQQQVYERVMAGVLPQGPTAEGALPLDIPNALAQATRLRQAALDPILFGGASGGGKAAWIRDYLYAQKMNGETLPTLIFTNYAEYAALLHRTFGGALLIGSMSTEQRELNRRIFLEGKTDLFFLSAEAGGFGLNLQRACRVIHTDLPWTPDVWQQCTGRAYRQGQLSPVHEIVLLHRGTIDTRVLRLLQRKDAISDRVKAVVTVMREIREGR